MCTFPNRGSPSRGSDGAHRDTEECCGTEGPDLLRDDDPPVHAVASVMGAAHSPSRAVARASCGGLDGCPSNSRAALAFVGCSVSTHVGSVASWRQHDGDANPAALCTLPDGALEHVFGFLDALITRTRLTALAGGRSTVVASTTAGTLPSTRAMHSLCR